MKSTLPKLAKDLAALVGIARKESDPEKIEAALLDARGQNEVVIAEREAVEAAYREGLLEASPADSERQFAAVLAAKVKVDRAEALVAALTQRLTQAREDLDRAARKAIHDDAVAKCEAIRARLPEEYRVHAMALRSLLRDLAAAEVARELAKPLEDEFGRIEPVEYGLRGLGGVAEEVIEQNEVVLWTINGETKPLPENRQRRVHLNPNTGEGQLLTSDAGSLAPSAGFAGRGCSRYRYKRTRYREGISPPYNTGSLLNRVSLPAFHAYGDDFVTAQDFRGADTALAHLSRDLTERSDHERPIQERLEMVTEERADGARVATPLRSVA